MADMSAAGTALVEQPKLTTAANSTGIKLSLSKKRKAEQTTPTMLEETEPPKKSLKKALPKQREILPKGESTKSTTPSGTALPDTTPTLTAPVVSENKKAEPKGKRRAKPKTQVSGKKYATDSQGSSSTPEECGVEISGEAAGKCKHILQAQICEHSSPRPTPAISFSLMRTPHLCEWIILPYLSY